MSPPMFDQVAASSATTYPAWLDAIACSATAALYRCISGVFESSRATHRSFAKRYRAIYGQNSLSINGICQYSLAPRCVETSGVYLLGIDLPQTREICQPSLSQIPS